MKVHPKISQILLLHGPFFTCPFCKTIIARQDKTKAAYHYCPNDKCPHHLIISDIFYDDKNAAIIAFDVDKNGPTIILNFQKHNTTIKYLSRDSNGFKTDKEIIVESFPNFNFADLDSIKEKLKLLLTFS